MLKYAAFAILTLLVSGCATIDYSRLPAGSFTGSVLVMWVGEGNSSGDGTFLFVPDPQDPLIFRRADPRSPGSIIRPGMMYTDGGSIPRIAQAFNGLSPWGYAPAYMIHDWMFVAHHCLVDGNDDKIYVQVRDVTFEDSAAILGEAIQGLVEQRRVKRDDVVGSTITTAVDSSIARKLWDERGACANSKVKPQDIAAAEQAVPGSSHSAVGRRFRVPESTPEARVVRPAKVITRVTF